MINLEDFLKKSVSLIDSADINREISKCNYQFSKELLNKDLEIAQMDTKIQSIKRRPISKNLRYIWYQLSVSIFWF